MKKNLILAVCFTLLLGATGMAAALDYDSIIAFGNAKEMSSWTGWDYIMKTYVDEEFECLAKRCGFQQENQIPPATNPLSDDTLSFYIYHNKDEAQPIAWTYLIIQANNTKDWYLFYNDYQVAGEDTFDIFDNNGDIIFTSDFILTIPEFGALISGKRDNDAHDGTWVWYDEWSFSYDGENSNNQVDVTIWFPRGEDVLNCVDDPNFGPDYRDDGNGGCCRIASGYFNSCDDDPNPAPEPGSILLLGTGVVGLGLVAKRKLTKK